MNHTTRNTERRLFWAGHIKACVASGLSVPEYGRQQGLKVSTWYWWRRRLTLPGVPETPTPQWIPVTGNAIPTASGVRLQLGRLTIALDPDFDPATLRRVLETVGA